jgi:hypothetical protein
MRAAAPCAAAAVAVCRRANGRCLQADCCLQAGDSNLRGNARIARYRLRVSRCHSRPHLLRARIVRTTAVRGVGQGHGGCVGCRRTRGGGARRARGGGGALGHIAGDDGEVGRGERLPGARGSAGPRWDDDAASARTRKHSDTTNRAWLDALHMPVTADVSSDTTVPFLLPVDASRAHRLGSRASARTLWPSARAW